MSQERCDPGEGSLRHCSFSSVIINLFTNIYLLTFLGFGGAYHTVAIDTDQKHIFDCPEAYRIHVWEQDFEAYVGGGSTFIHVLDIRKLVQTQRSNSKRTPHDHRNHRKRRRMHASNREGKD